MKTKIVGLYIIIIFSSCTNQTNHKDSILLKHEICKLPDILHESSGAAFYKNLLWSFNDSGGDAAIYGFDTISKSITNIIRLVGIKNIDWESMFVVEPYFYIADIGNNTTNREVFQIYRFTINQVSFFDSVSNVINIDTIEFSISPADLDFLDIPQPLFDAEAFIVRNDSILIFNKDWIHFKSAVFYVSDTPGRHTAELIGEVDKLEGVVTDAAIDGDKIVLLGYNKFESFLFFMDDTKLKDEISGKRYEIDNMIFKKTEGIASINHRFFITCEDYLTLQALYEVYYPN